MGILRSPLGVDSKPPSVLMISPARLISPLSEVALSWSFSEESLEKSTALGSLYASVAEQAGVLFLDASQIQAQLPVKYQSVGDGIHLSVHMHAALGEAVARIARQCFHDVSE